MFDGTGALVRIMRRPLPPEEATAEDMAAWRERLLADVPEPAQPQFESLLYQFPSPSHVPVYNRLLVGATGSVWLERYGVPFGASGRWDVYDGGGGFLGTVEVPPEFTVLEVTEDELLGVWTDDSGVESVRIYELDRSGG